MSDNYWKNLYGMLKYTYQKSRKRATSLLWAGLLGGQGKATEG